MAPIYRGAYQLTHIDDLEHHLLCYCLKMPLNTKISAFKTVTSLAPEPVTLAGWIRSIMNPSDRPDLCALIDQVLAAGTEAEQKKAKLMLPACAPGGVCENGHGLHRLQTISGYMAFDIDAGDNPHLPGGPELRKAVANLREVLFCALSTRGTGCWGVVRVPVVAPDYGQLEPDVRGRILDDYKARHKQLITDFAKFGIHLDSTKGGNPSDLRYWAPDPDAYIDTDAPLYMGKAPDPDPVKREPTGYTAPDRDPGHKWTHETRIEHLAEQISKDQIDITAGVKNWYAIGYDIAGLKGSAGRALFHAVSEHHPDYDRDQADRVYDNILSRAPVCQVPKAFYKFAKIAGLSFMPDGPDKKSPYLPPNGRNGEKAHTTPPELRQAEDSDTTPLILTKYTEP